MLIPVAPGPGRALVPLCRIFACGGCPALSRDTGQGGWKGLLVAGLYFCFFLPPSITLSMLITDSETSSGSQRGWGQRERRENENAAVRGSRFREAVSETGSAQVQPHSGAAGGAHGTEVLRPMGQELLLSLLWGLSSSALLSDTRPTSHLNPSDPGVGAFSP